MLIIKTTSGYNNLSSLIEKKLKSVNSSNNYVNNNANIFIKY